MRPIVYLIAIEDVARSPLIRSQVFTLLKTIAAQQSSWPLALVAVYPIGNWLRFRRQLADIRTELSAAGVGFHVLPIAFLTRHFYIPRILLPFYLVQTLLIALWIALRLRPVLVHCRSYPAAIAGRMIKHLIGAGLLFDTRALYPEEGATLAEGGKAVLLDAGSFSAWKRIETELLANSEAIVVVSAPSATILVSQYCWAKDRLVVLPTCTRIEPHATIAAWREQARQELGLTDHLVVVYAGSWFEPRPTIELFRRLMQARPSAKWYFLLLVSNRAQGHDDHMGDTLITIVRRELGLEDNCKAIAAPQERVAYYLAAADLAAQPVEASEQVAQDERYLLTVRTRLSIKFAEYLACGLPVLVSRWAGAAAVLVNEHDLGIVYDQSSPEEVTHWLARWQKQRTEFQMRAWQFARTHFSIEIVADGYVELYHSILNRHSLRSEEDAP